MYSRQIYSRCRTFKNYPIYAQNINYTSLVLCLILGRKKSPICSSLDLITVVWDIWRRIVNLIKKRFIHQHADWDLPRDFARLELCSDSPAKSSARSGEITLSGTLQVPVVKSEITSMKIVDGRGGESHRCSLRLVAQLRLVHSLLPPLHHIFPHSFRFYRKRRFLRRNGLLL